MKNRPAFYVLLGLLGALVAVMLLPFVTPVLVAAVLGYLLHPLYDRMGRVLRSENARAALLVAAVFFLLALPVLVLVVTAVQQVPHALAQSDLAGLLLRLNGWLDRIVGRHLPLVENLRVYTERARETLLHVAPGILGAVGATLVSLFIMLYTLFYVFTDGRRAWDDLVALIPLDPGMKPHLVATIQSTMNGVLYGQFMTAVIQAGLSGMGFLFFGIRHALLWTLATLVMAMVPVVGAVLVWLPLALSRLAAGDRFAGIGLLIYCGVLVTAVDHVVKPRLIAGRSELHPLAALFGVFGGIKLFGVVGFVLGPVLLGLLSAMLRFHREISESKAQSQA